VTQKHRDNTGIAERVK